MGARCVVLTDLEQQLPLLRSNIAFNEDDHAGCLVSAAALPWGERPTGALARERFDLILGCEVTYIDALLEPLRLADSYRTTNRAFSCQSPFCQL